MLIQFITSLVCVLPNLFFSEKSKVEDDKRFSELQHKLEEEIAKRQETEAELAQAQRMYNELKVYNN